MNNYFYYKKSIPLLFILCLLSLNFLFCDFQKPAAPVFETNVNVPLIAKTYFMDEMVDETDYLKSGESGDLYFEAEENIKRFHVGENLKIGSRSENFGSRLGKFKINPPGSKSTNVLLSEVASEVSQYDGQSISVEPFDMIPTQKTLEPFPNYHCVDVDSGYAEVKVTNNFIFTIGEPLELVITETTNGREITRSQINKEIPPGESEAVLLDLSNRTLPRQMSVTLSGHCAGSKGKLVRIDAESSLQIDVSLTEFVVSAASAQIPEQNVKQVNEISLSDSMIIREAKIQSGIINLELGGTLPIRSFLSYELPDFYDQNGEILNNALWLETNQKIREEIDLTGYTFKPEFNGNQAQSLKFNWRFKTQDTGDEFIELYSDDSLATDIELSKIKFESVTGIITALTVELEPETQDINTPSDLDSLLLSDAELELFIENSINFPATSNLTIVGRNEAGKEVPILVNDKINAAPQPGEIEETRIVLNETNSNVIEFLNALPNEVDILGNVVLGEDQWEGTIHQDDFIEGSFKVKTSLALAVPQQELETKVDEVELDKELQKRVEDHLLEGELWGKVENHLPIETNLIIIFGLVDSLVYEQPELSIGPIAVQPSIYSSDTGYSEEATTSDIEISLTAEQLKIFKNDPLFVGLLVEIPGTNGQVVRVTETDFLNVTLSLKLKVLIGPTDN